MEKQSSEKVLSNIFHFIDDFNAVNNAGVFESNFTHIDTKELEIHRECFRLARASNKQNSFWNFYNSVNA